jgi:hypothetical protein
MEENKIGEKIQIKRGKAPFLSSIKWSHHFKNELGPENALNSDVLCGCRR